MNNLQIKEDFLQDFDLEVINWTLLFTYPNYDCEGDV